MSHTAAAGDASPQAGSNRSNSVAMSVATVNMTLAEPANAPVSRTHFEPAESASNPFLTPGAGGPESTEAQVRLLTHKISRAYSTHAIYALTFSI